ncbi:MAG TPA: winged helix-turn-helix domain-containing protein [Ktedonobacteraceae bacterium]|nr:winged helix-turn-helix domain-containing protein [Ktedonobacteraceae bacterium]
MQPKPVDGGLWSGPKVAEWMQKRLGRPIAPQQGWEYLKRVGYSTHVPRPERAKAGKEAQQA